MNYDGAVLLTSHDRSFLNRVASKILAIEDGNPFVIMATITAIWKQDRRNWRGWKRCRTAGEEELLRKWNSSNGFAIRQLRPDRRRAASRCC